MATTYTTAKYWNEPYTANSGFPGVITRVFSIDLAELTGDASYQIIADDVIKIAPLPPYAKFVNARVGTRTGGWDDHGTPAADGELQAYDGSVTKVLVAATTTPANVGTFANMSPSDTGYNWTTTDDDFYLRLKFAHQAAGDADTDCEILVEVSYVLFLEPADVAMRSGRDNTPT
jgi:hypothetical protein